MRLMERPGNEAVATSDTVTEHPLTGKAVAVVGAGIVAVERLEERLLLLNS